MKITFYGQNTLAIDVSGKHILVDPFISGNPFSKDKVDVLSLKADYILLTHAHEDHVLDAEAIKRKELMFTL
jgi:L-ascorbate metabolism protein UlaG (beta-lactamase superfamily)